MELKSEPIYQRILLKLSGESLLGEHVSGVSLQAIRQIVNAVDEVTRLGVEVAIVIGGGNFLRGEQLTRSGFDRVTADQMGMLATVMNGLALRDGFLDAHMPVQIMSSIEMVGVVDSYNKVKAITKLERKKVVIFAGGTGNPLFSTDSAASLRGIEIRADIILKATKVDGVYSADPKKDPRATLYKHLTYRELIERQLGVMDLTAICLSEANNMPVKVFNMLPKGILKRIVLGSDEGTLITRGGNND